jgi:hypothetical protein
MRPLLGRIALFLMLAAAAPAAAESSRVAIIEYGIYAAGAMTHVPAPDQIGGQRWRAETRLIEKTETVAGQLGRIFGIRVQVNDPALLGKTVTMRIRHPKMTAPSGRSGTETFYKTSTPPGQREIGYFFAFEYTYEIAEGDWTFEVVHDGKVLAAKKFRVLVNMY